MPNQSGAETSEGTADFRGERSNSPAMNVLGREAGVGSSRDPRTPRNPFATVNRDSTSSSSAGSKPWSSSRQSGSQGSSRARSRRSGRLSKRRSLEFRWVERFIASTWAFHRPSGRAGLAKSFAPPLPLIRNQPTPTMRARVGARRPSRISPFGPSPETGPAGSDKRPGQLGPDVPLGVSPVAKCAR